MEQQQPQLKPKRKFILLITNLISVFVFLMGIVVLVVSLASASSTKKQIAEAKKQMQDQLAETNSKLDSKIERLENLTLKLKEQGYVEKDEFGDLANRILAAVVLVTSTKESIALSPTGEITTTREFDPEGSSGSGFLVRSDGLVATARHVVEAIGPDNLVVVLPSGQKLNAAVVATDKAADVALIKIEGRNYPALELGQFENLNTGDEVGLAGFALSAGITKPLVHRGVVSAKGTDQGNAKIFTINAFINRGNSGGPVFSAKTGRVIGVIAARQRDKTSEKIITLPPGYSPSVTFGGTDPVRLTIELYNKTLGIVGDVSQVGIGIAYSTDALSALLPKP